MVYTKRKILVIDSDPVFKTRLEGIMAAVPTWGGQLYLAADNATALELFATVHPDIVIVAVETNVALSESVCKAIRAREQHRHTGIIFFCKAKLADNDLLPVQCLEAGADDFLAVSTSDREIGARISAVLRLKTMTDELRSANHKLEVLSLTDDLTGLHNMRSFNKRYHEMLEECRQGRHGLALIMMDLDRFKSINDSCNHLVGSFIIGEVGKLIRTSKIFAQDKTCPARYGGDEYVICYEAGDEHSALERAEQLRALIGSVTFCKDGNALQVTASVGVCFIPPGFVCQKPEHVIKGADMMLYKSKQEGRDRTSGMVLRYPVDFDHIGGAHLIDRRAAGKHKRIS